MSDKVVFVDSKLVESSERLKDTVCKSKERPTKEKKEQTTSEKTVEKAKVTVQSTQVRETQQESSRDKKYFKLESFDDALKVREIQKTESAKDKKYIQKSEVPKLEVSSEAPKMLGTQKMESPKDAKDVKDVKPNISAKIPEGRSVEDIKADKNASKPKMIPVLEKVSSIFIKIFIVSK